jgi:hypothetical protein
MPIAKDDMVRRIATPARGVEPMSLLICAFSACRPPAEINDSPMLQAVQIA